MISICLLTGSEPRHRFIHSSLASAAYLSLGTVIYEDLQLSLENRAKAQHQPKVVTYAQERAQHETRYFESKITPDLPHHLIHKGDINTLAIQERLIKENPDLILTFGCSLIKGPLLEAFNRRIINLHLGLSPYYRGSSTNIMAYLNHDLAAIGATFHWLDAGIDSGEIIHQVRAQIRPGDSPHDIGHRLIEHASLHWLRLLETYPHWDAIQAPSHTQQERLIQRKEFDDNSVEAIHDIMQSRDLSQYNIQQAEHEFPIVRQPCCEDIK